MKPRLALSLVAVLVLPSSAMLPEAHDGDWNIFPGNARVLLRNQPIQVLGIDRGYAGELVPPEDSDQVPRLEPPVWRLRFRAAEETYQYTQTLANVRRLRDALIDRSGREVYINYYYGGSFRDGVARVSECFY